MTQESDFNCNYSMCKVQKQRTVTVFLPEIGSQEMLLVLVTTDSSNTVMQSSEIKTISGLLNNDDRLDGTVLGGLILAR